jgi:hypothetical protein
LQSRTPILGAEQFRKVSESAKEFDRYLKELNMGKDDSQLARDWKLRLDEWEEYGSALRDANPILAHRKTKKKRRMETSSESESDSSAKSSSDHDSEEDSDGKQKRKRRKKRKESA